MGIEEYTVFSGRDDYEKCRSCGTQEDLTMDEDGDYICTDCLFEEKVMDDGREERI